MGNEQFPKQMQMDTCETHTDTISKCLDRTVASSVWICSPEEERGRIFLRKKESI